MADDKKKNENNTNPNNVNVNKPVQQTPAPRKLVVDDGDVSTVDEVKAALNDTSVDITSILEEYEASIKEDTKSRIRNIDKTPLSVPLTDADSLPPLAEKVIAKVAAENRAGVADEIEDYASDYHAVYNASEYYSSGNEMLKNTLSKADTDKLVNSIPNVKEGVAGIGVKHIDPDNPRKVYSGEEGYRIFATITTGVRRVVLWNSGITLTLRNVNLRQLDNYLETVNHSDYEYGKEYGGWYYLFSSLVIDKHIVEQLLPGVIISSNYKDWQDTDKLLSQISLQDYQVILWALCCLMYPMGTDVAYVCGNKDCGHIHRERSDLSKLRLDNTALINEDMIKHLSERRVDDKSLERYRQLCNLDDTIEFEISDSGEHSTKYKIYLKQATIKDYIDTGREYNAELAKQIDVTSREAVARYITYNQNRCYRPWIKSIECTVVVSGKEIATAIVENDGTGKNDATIGEILDSIQQNYPKFNKEIQDYIQRTKISHIAFFMDKCPKCGTKPVTSINGYIPYDMAQAFFILGRMKLLRISYQQNEQQDSNDTSKNTSNS